ncbi:MAG: long-chain fatty acid--CoA ligase [Xanthomonadales bacterium]|nr:long-chain fatty acid--CoA ligase [Xanthomonadales bacterium]
MQDCVTDWIRYHAHAHGKGLATVDLFSGRRQTFGEMHERVGRIATLLREAGVGPGDRVGVLSQNSTDVLDILFAVWRVGATHLALNFRLTASELRFIVEDAEPTVLFFDTAFGEVVDKLRAEEGPQWIAMDGTGQGELEDRIAAARPLLDGVDNGPEDRCMLMYSSGTTGTPKGVVITHGMILAQLVSGVPAFDLHSGSVSYAVLPLFHIAAMMGFSLTVLFAGGTAVVERQLEPDRIFDALGDPDLGITHFMLVPALWSALRQHPRAQTTDYSGIRAAYGGAEPLAPALVQWWYDAGLPIREVYGMTETCGGACVIKGHEVPEKAGSAGKALMLTELKTMRLDGSEAEPGEIGELWARGPNILREYWRRPEETAAAIVDGWLRTGDMARIDADGYVYVEDRLKDMYISGGENVYPAEVEHVLAQLPGVREVAVIGLPDPDWGETGCAVIAGDESLTAAAVLEHCREHLARYKHPGRVEFVEALPRNATGKILKYQLRESFG